MNDQQFVRACSRGDLEKINLAIEQGIPIDATDQYGLSGLILAARKGNIETATVLLNSGAEIDFQDVRGRTPLFHAVCFNRIEMVQLLAERGATIDVLDKHGCTPCKMAESQFHEKIVELLISFGSKTCSPENKFIEINIGLDGLRAKLVNSVELAEVWVQKARDELNDISVKKLKDELDAVCVILVLGLDLPLQPVDFEDRVVATDTGFLAIESEDQMRDRVYAALSDGYHAIADYLESHFSETFEFEKFRNEIKAAFERLSDSE